MALPADFTLTEQDGRSAVILSGDWTARGLFDAGPRLAKALEDHPDLSLDLTGVNRCDTAGAYAILRAAGVPIGKADYVGHMFRYLRQPPATAEG